MPVSFLADRFGRVRSITAMALVWGCATIACGLTASYPALLATRAMIGLGEAGYGGAGGAVLVRVFPPRRRAMVTGAFQAAAFFGSLLGVALGGALAARFGWRIAFFAIGVIGVVLAVAYRLAVREPASDSKAARAQVNPRAIAREVFGKRAAVLCFTAYGLAAFAVTAYVVWLPSYFDRYYGMATADAALTAAMLVLATGVGMIACGQVADRVARKAASSSATAASAFSVLGGAFLIAGLALPPGGPQLALLGAGMFFVAGCAGPTVALIAGVTSPSIHATVLAFVALFGTLIGQAPGAFVTGVVADAIELRTALQLAAIPALLSGALFVWAARAYGREVTGRVPACAHDRRRAGGLRR